MRDIAVEEVKFGADFSEIASLSKPCNEGSPISISGSALLHLIRNGNLQEYAVYSLSLGEFLNFQDEDSDREYDLKHITVCACSAQGGAAVSISSCVQNLTIRNAFLKISEGDGVHILEGSENLTFENVYFDGKYRCGVNCDGKYVRFERCGFSTSQEDEGVGVHSNGQGLLVYGSSFSGGRIGVVSSASDAVIENCLFRNHNTGVQIEKNDMIIWHTTVQNSQYGIRALFEKAEMSAGEGVGYNILVAQNDLSECNRSVFYQNVSNCVILLNEMSRAEVVGCVNAYINENIVHKCLWLEDNDYIIANGNLLHGENALYASGNTNTNGDQLTDLNLRSTVGVNEALLPHINVEQFVGMKRKKGIDSADGFYALSDYLTERMKRQSVVIVPPGAYVGEPIQVSDAENVTIYAYGVLNEIVKPEASTFYFQKSRAISIKGMFIGYATYSHIQGTILDVRGNTVDFRADPGYYRDFTAEGQFPISVGRVLAPDCRDAYSMITRYGSKSYDPKTQVNTVVECSWTIPPKIGDRIAFCDRDSDHGFHYKECTEMVLEDVTDFGCSGFSEFDTDNGAAPILHRYAVKVGPSPLIDDTDVASDFDTTAVYRDVYNRLRSAEPLLTSFDAVHTTNARIGAQMISCLFEMTDDDVTNINAFCGTLQSFDPKTNVLTYTRYEILFYRLLPSAFRPGDVLTLFSMSGKRIGDVQLEEASRMLSDNEFSVQLPNDFSFEQDALDMIVNGQETILVQNSSASGNGFLIDNIRTVHCRGRVLIQAFDGVIRNSDICGLNHGGVICYPQYAEWPEVGFVKNLKILQNRFYDNNIHSQASEDWQDAGIMTDVVIRNINSRSYTSDPDYCLQENILIMGNEFSNRRSRYSVSVNFGRNIQILDNVFLPSFGKEDVTDTQAPVLILGGNGIEVDGNQFPSGIDSPVENRSNIAQNVFGRDVGDIY